MNIDINDPKSWWHSTTILLSENDGSISPFVAKEDGSIVIEDAEGNDVTDKTYLQVNDVVYKASEIAKNHANSL